MRLTIDNLDGRGEVDYTGMLDASVTPRVQRTINQPSTFQCGLLGGSMGFVVPVQGARLVLTKGDGTFIFTGYLSDTPQYEYLGWGQQGSVYRYKLAAESDEVLLDQKALPNRAPFVARSAGSALRQLVQDLLPGGFDTSAVEDVDVLASYAVNPQKSFTFHAAEIASTARASYRAMNGALTLAPIGTASYTISDRDANFSPAGLKLNSPRILVNDVTLIGLEEPKAYVRDYFVGDGLSLRFYLSQTPFQQSKAALIDEQYLGPGLDPATWKVSDPASAVSIVAQTLQVNGGNGQDGKTTVEFLEADRTRWSVRTATRRSELHRAVARNYRWTLLRERVVCRMSRRISGNTIRNGKQYSSDRQRERNRPGDHDDGGASLSFDDIFLFDGSLPVGRDLSLFIASGGSWIRGRHRASRHPRSS